MKVTVDIPEFELDEICFFTGEKKKGPAIRKMVIDALMLKRRQKLAQKFISGEWSAELEGFEDSQAEERKSAAKRTRAWRK